MLQFVLDVLKISLPLVILLVTAILLAKNFLGLLEKSLQQNGQLVQNFLKNESDVRLVDLRHKHQQVVLPLRLQAYERMMLFCSRMEMSQVLSRLDWSELNAKQLRMLIKVTVEDEYQHNVTQQVYMTDELWQMIVIAKAEVMDLADKILVSLPAEASARDYVQALERYLQGEPQIGYLQAQRGIKKEIQQLF